MVEDLAHGTSTRATKCFHPLLRPRSLRLRRRLADSADARAGVPRIRTDLPKKPILSIDDEFPRHSKTPRPRESAGPVASEQKAIPLPATPAPVPRAAATNPPVSEQVSLL